MFDSALTWYINVWILKKHATDSLFTCIMDRLIVDCLNDLFDG